MSDDVPIDPARRPAGGSAASGPRKLRVVSFQAAAALPGSEPALRLVREYKGPTVSALLHASPTTVSQLPGRVCNVLEAIVRGDLEGAERRLDAALNVLRGPGSAPRSTLRILGPWLLVMWVVAAIATAILLVP